MIKKILLWLSTSVLTLSVLGFIFSFGFSRLLQPQIIQGWIEKSGTYDKLPDALLARAQAMQRTRNEETIDYSNPLVRDAAKAALPRDFIEQSSKDITNATFTWLDGKDSSADFTINIQSAKQTFADSLASSLKARYESLDSCEPNQMPDGTDPFTINCRPMVDISIDSIIATESAKLLQNTDFLANPDITAQNILPAEAGEKANPYNHSELPNAYQALQTSPFIFLTLVALSAISTLLLANSKKRGARKIGWRFITAGILSLLLINLGALGLTKVSEAATTQNATAAITAYKDLISAGLNAVRSDSAKILLATAIPVLVLGIILLLTTRTKKTKTTELEVEPKQDPIASPPVATEKSAPSTTAKPATPRAKPAQQKTAPLLKPKQQQKPTVVTPGKRLGSNDTLIQ